jgi:RNA polymerase sigma-70 factor (ECF subfamily)
MLDTPRSLLARLADAPAEADWRRLVQLYQPFIGGWLARAGVPDQDAADLGQDVLATLVREIGGFRHADRTGAFRKWLRTVVVHRTRNYWRGRDRAAAAAAVLDELADPSSGLSGEWDREHDAHVARRLLAAVEGEFAPHTWVAFRRQVLDGLRAADAAIELGTTVNAVLIAKSRVLRRLRQEAGGLVDAF